MTPAPFPPSSVPTKLSKNYTLAEASQSDTARRLGLDNTPPADVVENMRRVARALEQINAKLAKVLKPGSWYRSREVNHAVGGSCPCHGAKRGWSYHTFGLAVDFDPPPGMTHDFLQKLIAADPAIPFDLVMEENTADGKHRWLHLQLAKAGKTPRRMVRDAEIAHLGAPVTRTTVG